MLVRHCVRPPQMRCKSSIAAARAQLRCMKPGLLPVPIRIMAGRVEFGKLLTRRPRSPLLPFTALG
jgi:hypothetical protein